MYKNIYKKTDIVYNPIIKVMEIQIGGQIHDEKNSYCTVCNEWKKFTGWT